jgi:RNA polymerase sigma-70 factor (ECF subfamily)
LSGQDEIKSLIERTARGDRTAFRALYQQTVAKLNAVVLRILQRNEMAEEALQETYVRIWQNSATFDASIASPIAWMAAIARNQAIDLRRRSAEKIARLSHSYDEALLEIAHDNPGSVGETGLARSRLERCLGQLPPERRDLILRAYIEGYTREELALRAAKPVATIKSLLRRSLIMLKDCLDGGD